MTICRRSSCGALMLCAPRVVLAHTGRAPEPHDLWRAWTFAPFVIIALVLCTALYLCGVTSQQRHARRVRAGARMQHLCFAGGITALLLALVTPIDAVGSALFAVHMVQHLLLIGVAAPLLVLGDPLIVTLWALPIRTRRRMGSWWRHARAVHRLWRIVRIPLVAWTLHIATLWLWHLPRLYDSAMFSEALHVLEHASFVLTALLFWWVVLNRRRHRLRVGEAVLYLFGAGLQSTLLGTLLAMARHPWYLSHLKTTVSWGVTPLEDQQLAGLIMWIPAGFVYLAPVLLLLRPALIERRGELCV